MHLHRHTPEQNSFIWFILCNFTCIDVFWLTIWHCAADWWCVLAWKRPPCWMPDFLIYYHSLSPIFLSSNLTGLSVLSLLNTNLRSHVGDTMDVDDGDYDLTVRHNLPSNSLALCHLQSVLPILSNVPSQIILLVLLAINQVNIAYISNVLLAHKYFMFMNFAYL